MPQLTVFIAILCGFCSCGGLAVAAPDLPEVRRQMAHGANRFRAEQGRSPLREAAALTAAAAEFATYMARTDRYGHGADGRTPVLRAEGQRYRPCLVAENIAYQFNTDDFESLALATGFVEGWIASPPHRANLLDADAVDTGIAVARSGRSGRYYAVQMFGRPDVMSVHFRVRNDSGRKASYRIGDERFSLPSRAIASHTVCRVPALWLDGGGARATPRDGELWRIERGAGGVRWRRQGLAGTG